MSQSRRKNGSRILIMDSVSINTIDSAVPSLTMLSAVLDGEQPARRRTTRSSSSSSLMSSQESNDTTKKKQKVSNGEVNEDDKKVDKTAKTTEEQLYVGNDNASSGKDSRGSAGEYSMVAPKESYLIEIAPKDTVPTVEITPDAHSLPVVTQYVELELLPEFMPLLPQLTSSELQELETALEWDDDMEVWNDDWFGNLSFFWKDVANPESPKARGRRNFLDWALESHTSRSSTSPIRSRKLVEYLLAHIYHMPKTPPTAKRLLAHASVKAWVPSFDLSAMIKRISYDPTVLQEDGWTTAKSDTPDGATGGAFQIGTHIWWKAWEAVVIAYVHDEDIGDLWKAMWLKTFETFDLEAEELQMARQKWQKRKSLSSQSQQQQERKHRGGRSRSSSDYFSFPNAPHMTLEGIEHGIVLAAPSHPHARQGVFWPARVMHVSELDRSQGQGYTKRSSTSKKVSLVFLAPYWNGGRNSSNNGKHSASSEHLDPGNANIFSSGPLFEMDDTVVSDETLQKYPYDDGGDDERHGLNVDQIRMAFRFTGLPKAAFSRFLDSHRMALALKCFARNELSSSSDVAIPTATAAMLTDTHAFSIQTAMFPSALLHLPFEYILSHLPPPGEERSPATDHVDEDASMWMEPIVDLQHILNAMKPPHCWGILVNKKVRENNPRIQANQGTPPTSPGSPSPHMDPPVSRNHRFGNQGTTAETIAETAVTHGGTFPNATLKDIASMFLLNEFARLKDGQSPASKLVDHLTQLVARLRQEVSAATTSENQLHRRKTLRLLSKQCLITKCYGDDIICSEELTHGNKGKFFLMEWRKACERIYRHASLQFSCSEYGNGLTLVVTDSRCNQHITNDGCFERPVRLPAALKGARLAATGSCNTVRIVTTVEDKYMELAESQVIEKAHSVSYLKRMKLKCSMLSPETIGAPLTEDSGGEGGEDTKGSRGTFTAAVAGVAAAIKAVDMIVGGECVNVFCATRPPGHHAGKELHPMKAVSNGFCILNTVACAALYATTAASENGPGLRRVCVIDFDVHHGNGTQDILCSTYDPRFLYVSLHAGGAHVNGYDTEDESDTGDKRAPGGKRQEGIFPGRCGDTSPHKGVVNIPLGTRVTPHGVGNALVSIIGPAVESFAPDLIILSAGFDAHKNDPLGMGGLSASDFGSITHVACSLAFGSCSGRVLSILEGGYGVPCCRPQKDWFLPGQLVPNSKTSVDTVAVQNGQRAQPTKLADLGDCLPEDMDDQVPYVVQKKLDRCHDEGFIQCVCEHVRTLGDCNTRGI